MDDGNGALAAEMREAPALKTGAPIRQLGGDEDDDSNAAVGRKRGSKTEHQLTPVDVFAPWAGEAERALRVRIHRARDTTTARATRCKHGDARTIYWLAAQIASARVFARMPNDDLKETIDNLGRLFLVAGWLERTELPDVE